ncbi:flagellin [Reinekea blandensis]|uniref:Flagellin n=1 Tax=Reinekea blandensis MED297 TaxID=314283 RepID=A4BEN7_9GAMM|nr:flagellin [Reinekea blandensis]EAR09464.1 Flagellin and related hook-associated protein [Reinekea sp. MED297] [Reinekea blandensis MED297]
MPQIINTNIASLTAQRNLNTSQGANATALERLSSGLRINSAKDDAAGLAISTKFESQVKGLNVAIRNAGDGISLAQTAEGALGSMTENLQRIRELAVQSSNATNSDDDRVALQQEVKQLMAEVSRTASETNFNGRNLLDGTFKGTFQIGADAGQTVDVQISELTAEKLGASDQVGVSSIGTDYGISNGDLVLNGVQIGPSSATDDTASTIGGDASAIAKVATINRYSDETGVTAFANENEVNGSTMAANGGTTATVILNGVSINLQATTNNNDVEKAATRQSVIEAINAKSDQTGVVATDGGNENGVILTAEDGRNITLTSGATQITEEAFGLGTVHTAAAAQTTGTSVGVYEAGFTLVANGDTKTINIEGGDGTGTGDLANTGLTEGSYKRETSVYSTEAVTVTSATAATAARVTNVAIAEGDLVINGVTIGASSSVDDKASDTVANSSDASASGIAVAAAINRSADDTGVTAYVNETVVVGVTGAATAATAGDSIGIMINGVDIGDVVSQGDIQKDRAATIDAINNKSGQTGVMATDNGEGITLTAADGRNISVALVETGAGTAAQGQFGLSETVDGIGAIADGATSTLAAATFDTGASTTYSTVRLESAGTIDIDAGSNGTTGLTDTGFARGEYGGGMDGTYLKDVDISTFQGAQDAITAIDNALKTVASQRAELGALQNRFESTSSNLQITSENLAAANSRIRDADFAAETAELSRTQVLQQAGISILAQANQRPQQVLSLLG